MLSTLRTLKSRLALPLAFYTALAVAGCSRGPALQHQPARQAQAASKPQAMPDGIDPNQTSTDPNYGYKQTKPVQFGGPENLTGPQSEQVYLNHLRDSQFNPLTFERLCSVGPGADGHMLDEYELVSSSGKKYELYLDMYHPKIHPFRVKAPKGLYFWK